MAVASVPGEIEIDSAISKIASILEEYPVDKCEVVEDFMLFVDVSGVSEIPDDIRDEFTEEFQPHSVHHIIGEKVISSVTADGDKVETIRQAVHAA